MHQLSAAHVIAQAVCECEGKDWLEIEPTERDRYARIGILAEYRLRNALLDGETGLALATTLIIGKRAPEKQSH